MYRVAMCRRETQLLSHENSERAKPLISSKDKKVLSQSQTAIADQSAARTRKFSANHKPLSPTNQKRAHAIAKKSVDFLDTALNTNKRVFAENYEDW